MTDTIRPARTNTYEHTISGLLTKRVELFHEAERIRDRLAEIKNDVARHGLGAGHAGLHRGSRRRHAASEAGSHLRPGRVYAGRHRRAGECRGHLTSRQVAEAILSVSGQDARDRKLMADHTRRVSKALRVLKGEGLVKAAKDSHGNMLWRLLSRVAVGGSEPPRVSRRLLIL